jgi:O-antigen/teichoic acid export membrane protein
MIFRQLAKDSIIYGGADLVGKLIAFFTFPIVAAALSPKAFGALEIILTSITLFGVVINCGLNNSVQRFYWDQDTENNQQPIIVSNGLFILIIFSLIGFVVGLVLISIALPYLKDDSFNLSGIGLFSAVCFLMFAQWQNYLLDVLRLHFVPIKFLSVSLISRVLTAVMAMIAVVYFKLGLDGYLGVQSFVTLLVLPLSLYFVKKDLILSFNRRWIVKLVDFGYPFIFASMAYWVFGSMDRWLLAGLSSLEETGVYSIAFRFSTIVLFVSTAFGMAWSPVSIKVKTDHPEEYRKLYSQVFFLLLYVMLIVGGGLALFSGEIIYLLMPKEYAGAALPLSILCFGIILQASQQVTAIGISLEKKTFLFARLAWVTAIINFVLNWLLIPLYGAIGSASATTISYFVLTGSYLFFTQKLHPLPISWKRLGLILFLGFIVGFFAICFNQVSFDLKKIGIKLTVAFICLWLGWRILPIKEMRIKHSIS